MRSQRVDDASDGRCLRRDILYRATAMTIDLNYETLSFAIQSPISGKGNVMVVAPARTALPGMP
jgi:hypothetical protein